MFKNLRKRTEGFTIIEVLIVLAIAGLIMLIVFLAVPALQRNQRNTSRNSDATRIAAAITECLANRNGTVASCNEATEIEEGTLSTLTLPAGPYPSGAVGAGTTTQVEIGFNRACDAAGTDDTGTSPSARSFVVTYRLEPAVDRCISS